MSEENKHGTWFGDFGIRYTIRNKVIAENLVPFYRKTLRDLNIEKILEVGCNRGHNLKAISYCGEYDLYGIDINPYSILIARENKEISFTVGSIFDILYKDNDKLYLPVDRMGLIQKYMGVDGITPVLDKMGGKSWERVKDRVKRSAEKIAGELLKLYAARKIKEGFIQLTWNFL